jgi:O-antigen/teichoic acid export membrane protein
MFGAGFEAGYAVMLILAAGLLARASVGPAERLLNMIGQRKQCATVYAIAFAINLTLCVILIPRLGIEGAAAATSIALVAESLMFAWVTKKRLGFNIFVFDRTKP